MVYFLLLYAEILNKTGVSTPESWVTVKAEVERRHGVAAVSVGSSDALQ